MYVMKVKHHKTMREGPAQRVMSEADWDMIQKYVLRVRNGGEAALVIEKQLLYKGKPLANPYYLLKKAAEACGVQAPTPMAV